jgi:asparagine synthetase B (glutamine-hydrolysing)
VASLQLTVDQACMALHYQIPVAGKWLAQQTVRIDARALIIDDDWPWIKDDSGIFLFFRGRIDSFDDTESTLNGLISIYQQDGIVGFKSLSGPFLIVIDDPSQPTVQVLRDPLGDQSAVYCHMGDHWLLASDERAMVAHHTEADAVFLKRAVAFLPAEADRTVLSEVHELPPGHSLKLGVGHCLAPHHTLDWPKVGRSRSIADHMSDLDLALRNAVGRCLDPTGTTAIAVSGGMDSSIIPVLACEFFPDRKIHLYSYRFEQFKTVDESACVTDLAERLGLDVTWIDGDQLGPFNHSDWAEDLPCGEVFVDAYRGLRRALYRSAREQGCRILLTGDFGDHLYMPGPYWLRDLLLAQPLSGFVSLLKRLRLSGLTAWRSDPVLRRCLPLVGRFAARPQPAPIWCRHSDLLATRPMSDLPRNRAVPGREVSFFSTNAARSSRMGYEEAARFGMDLRFVFRDLEVMRCFAQLPAWTLNCEESKTTKLIMRNLMAERLPRSILDQPGKASFWPLMEAGLKRAGPGLLKASEEDSRAIWARWFDPAWFEQHRFKLDAEEEDMVVWWARFGLKLWSDALTGRSSSIDGIDS